MSTQFLSTSNKGFLWNLMFEADVFGGVPLTKKDMVVKIFEDVMNEVSNNTSIVTLIEKNKAVIMKVNNSLNHLRDGNHVDNISSNEPPKLVTAAEISANRQERFADNLNERQRQFDDMMVDKKPAEVDFSDKSTDKKPIGSEMDDMLAKMMSMREQQLNQVIRTQDTSAAQTWINNDGTGSNAGPPTLQIGETVPKPKIEEVKPKKKVTFADESSEYDNLLSLFKVKERKLDKDAILTKIKEIESRVSELSSLVEVLKSTVG